MEVHVEIDAELVERLLDLGEHQLDPDRPEDFLRLVVGQCEGVGVCGEYLLGDVDDVLAGVAVLGGGRAAGAGE